VPSAGRLGPIGIDVALEALHLVQLEMAGGEHPRLRARASLPFDADRRDVLANPLQFRSFVRRALAADRFKGRRAVVAMPSGMFRTMSINYQSAPGKANEDAAVIRIIKDRLDGNLADYVVDYMPVNSRSKSDERLALVAVSERRTVIDFLELCRKSGLDVQAVEIGPLAVSRLVGALSIESGSKNILVVNAGRSASYLTLICGNDLLFDQEVAFGEDSLVAQAATTLDMAEDMALDLIARTGFAPSSRDGAPNDAELSNTLAQVLKPQFLKLVEEIKRVCLYAAAETRGGAVSQVYLLGGIARWPGTDSLLANLTGADVATIPDPLALFPSAHDEGGHQAAATAPEIVVATGAALRGLHPDG
jgi:Tfp pilus assembly PilM family ATPase